MKGTPTMAVTRTTAVEAAMNAAAMAAATTPADMELVTTPVDTVVLPATRPGATVLRGVEALAGTPQLAPDLMTGLAAAKRLYVRTTMGCRDNRLWQGQQALVGHGRRGDSVGMARTASAMMSG